MKPVAERRRPHRGKGEKRGPRPADWVNPVKGMVLRPGRTTAERFFGLVEKGGPGECWIWKGAKRPYGYGNFWLAGANVQAHRVSLELVGRKPGPDDAVDHLCKVPACVNPDHLRIVSHRQNALENNESPFAKNADRPTCKNGHSYTRENTAIKTQYIGQRANGKRLYGITRTRICLTCFPEVWLYAIVLPPPRPGTRRRKPWVGPQTAYFVDSAGIVRIPKTEYEENSN